MLLDMRQQTYLCRYGVTDIAIVTEGRTMGTSPEIPVQINRPITSLHYAVSSRIQSEAMAKTLFSRQCMDRGACIG